MYATAIFAAFSIWVGAGARLLNSRTGAAGRDVGSAPVRWKTEATAIESEPEAQPVFVMRFERAPRSGRHPGLCPWYRNASDLAEAIAACEAAIGVEPADIAIDHAKDLVASGRSPAMAPDDAARRFVAHLREGSRTEGLGNDDINRLYSEHCADLGVDEIPQNVLREAMKYVPGVFKRQIDRRGANGARKREFVWDVQADECRIAA